MDDKEAAEVLTGLVKAHPLSGEEKEAVLAAIGVLSWTKFAESRIKTSGMRRKEKERVDD